MNGTNNKALFLAFSLIFLFSVPSVFGAEVTIDEFGGFQDPFSGKFYRETLPLIESEYGDTVKLDFKHFPLSFHQFAQKAAEASECARNQGAFRNYHNILFENQDALEIDSLKLYASKLLLNREDFDTCLDLGKMESVVSLDVENGHKSGVTGTPAFFLNGEKISGAQPFNVFKEKIDELLDASPKGKDQQKEPIIGNPRGSVIITTYFGFESSFEGRFYKNTMPVILEKYEEVQFVFRNFPFSFHKNGQIAAVAGECAHAQGKFENYATVLFDNQDELEESDLKKYASKIGLAESAFNDCLDSEFYLPEVIDDKTDGENADVSGTPIFFIKGPKNTEKIAGAQSLEAFNRAIDKALGKDTPEPPTKSDQLKEPVLGSSNSQLKIIEYCDFEGPFCNRFFSETLPTIKEKYIDTGKVMLVYSDFPLSFHPNAQMAAEAAQCAHAQGKFWEMHDLLFENQTRLNRTVYKQLATQIGLNEKEFIACIDSSQYAPEVQHDIENAADLGVSATPTFFIGEKTIVGAYPTDDFVQIIENLLGNGSDPETDNPIPDTPENQPVDEEKSFCGNSACEVGENSINCPLDCTPITPQTCDEGGERFYQCVDKAQVSWCTCIGDNWRCIDSPEDSCSREETCNGCLIDGSCLGAGTRIVNQGTPSYCNFAKDLKAQSTDRNACQNSYECLSNNCSNGQCINIQEDLQETKGLVQQLIDLIFGIFGIRN
jgi:protein-disulfide isomerase